MRFKIGFTGNEMSENRDDTVSEAVKHNEESVRPSLVQVYFSGRNMSLAYYNDSFKLKVGDIVYVDGKLEGMSGRVTDVNYNFKIRLSDYKRVVAVADTEVHGKFYTTDSYFLTFDRTALPCKKVLSWVKMPTQEDDFVCGYDETSFCLNELGGMNVSTQTAEQGHKYYIDDKVKYISLDGTKGFAIVEGRDIYEVEFEYSDGVISRLTCSCYCSSNCKHEFAAMLELREILEIIESDYSKEYNRTGYFAAICKSLLLNYGVGCKKNVEFSL